MIKDSHLSQFYTPESSTDKPNKKYLISAKDEILRTLKHLAQQSKLVTVYLENTNDFIITTMVGIDEENYCVYIDDVKDNQQRKEILANTTLTITSQSKGIKYLFPVNIIGRTTYKNEFAFKLSFPDYVLKLQRREFYRATPPLDHAIKCQVNFDIGNTNVDIADISEGGLSLVDRDDALFIQTDTILKSCRINLPNFGIVESDLKINRIAYSHTGVKQQKFIGCEYVTPTNTMTSVIRRYIRKVERYSRSSDKVF